MSENIVNLSTVFRDFPRDERPAAAVAAGFRRVESWWEFESATPDSAELDAFLGALRDADVELTAVNSHGGNRAAGEAGLACLPDRVEEFRASIESISAVAAVTAARRFNVTFGLLHPDRWSAAEQFDVAAANYRWGAERVAEFGGTLLIEALSGEANTTYPMHTAYQVVDFLTERLSDVPNVRLLFDAYHLAANGEDVLKSWDDCQAYVGHVQFADFPGRGAPGTGDIDFDALRERIAQSAYCGDIALEYLG